MEDKKKFMARAIELSINSANTIGAPIVFALLIDSSMALAINFFLSSILIFYFIFNFVNTH